MININKYISVLGYTDLKNFLTKSYFKEPQVILNSLKQYAPDYDCLSNTQKNNYQNIYTCVKKIDLVLSQFNQFNIYPHVAVVGGCLYDSVLGITPKDYDVVIYFPYKNSPPVHNFLNNIKPDAYNIKDEKLLLLMSQTLLGFSVDSFPKIVELLIKKEFNLINKINERSSIVAEHYIYKSIKDVYKVTHKEIDKPIDIIISDEDCYNFLNYFDFNLCKMCIPYKGERNLKDFLANFYINPSSLYDLKDKKLTVNIDKFSDEEVNYFLNKHYLRLKEKLPDYQLSFRGRETPRVEKFILSCNVVQDKDNKKTFKI